MKFKIMTYNVQDLFLQTAIPLKPEYMNTLNDEHWSLLAETDQDLKPLSKLKAIARIIEDEAPDLICLCEVGGMESLERFNQLFLADRFTPYLVPGNSERGIESGFLLSKQLGACAHIVSHRDWPVPFQYLHEADPEAYFVTAQMAAGFKLGDSEARKLSRDIPVLHLVDARGAIWLSVMLVHLKSGFDPLGFDPGGQTRRAAEVKALVAIYHELKAKLGIDHPLIVTGDFNGNASREGTAAEFLPLYETTDLEDALHLAGVPRYERHTHLTFYGRKAAARQLDYIFLTGSLHAKLVPEATYVYRYRLDSGGGAMMEPFSFRDRNMLPSDHYPLFCTLLIGP